jgi:hypothetical protein
MKRSVWISLPGFAFLVAGCGPVPDSRSAEVDLRPPLVQAVDTAGPDEIRILFDEDAWLMVEKTEIRPPLAISGVTEAAKEIVIRGEAQVPGRAYTLEAEARDARGNSASFFADFYGWNPRVPRLLINEFTPRGSGNHPDLIELKVCSEGDMGGVVLYLGTPESFDERLVFPSFQVSRGSFIVVHCKPTGEPVEVNETADTAASGGLDASDHAFDFWIPGATGLPGNNGVLSLYERPGGKILDGVLYSNRSSQSDERYRGFGSAEMLARADELVKAGGWKPAGARVLPEDGVSPEGSTGTRSIGRGSASADTDTSEDWHVVPTRKASFGAENSDEVYAP